jgi:uncharacterized protein (TIGR02996 family)
VTSSRALEKAIIASPDDDALRLVYADWLEEHGEDVRAQFIRVQCALAKLSNSKPQHWLASPGLPYSVQAGEIVIEWRESYPPSDEEKGWLELRTREKWLLWHHGSLLRSFHEKTLIELGFAPPPDFSYHWMLHRGMLEEVEVSDGDAGASYFVQRLEDLFAHFPIRTLRFGPYRYSLCDSGSFTPDLEVLPGDHPIASDTLRRLSMTPCLTRLRTLDLRGNGLNDEAATILLSSPYLDGLKALLLGNLRSQHLTSAGEDIFTNSISPHSRRESALIPTETLPEFQGT